MDTESKLIGIKENPVKIDEACMAVHRNHGKDGCWQMTSKNRQIMMDCQTGTRTSRIRVERCFLTLKNLGSLPSKAMPSILLQSSIGSLQYLLAAH